MSKVSRYNIDMVNFHTGEDIFLSNCSLLESIPKVLDFFKSQVGMILPDEEVHFDIIVRRNNF